MTAGTLAQRTNDYPTSDGKPMAETDVHRRVMFDLIELLEDRYQDRDDVYVSGNLLLFYIPENKRKHLSPDVFVVHGIPKHERENYLLWEEGKGPDFVIEVTSKTTSDEDLTTKRDLYRTVFKVSEYFLFDPRREYLKPSLQGFRLVDGEYIPIEAIDGRLPSEQTGLHLEVRGRELRLYDPGAGDYLKTTKVQLERKNQELEEKDRELDEKDRALSEKDRALDEKDRLIEQLKRQLEQKLLAENGSQPRT